MTNSRGARRRPRPTASRRLVAYTRRSASSEAISSATQLESIRRWAEENGHLIVAEVNDAAPDTGLRSEGVSEALDMVEAHHADAVVVHKFSRFGRSSLDFEVNLGRLQNVRADLISCTEPLGEPAISHDWTLDMLAMLASFEDARLADINEASRDENHRG